MNEEHPHHKTGLIGEYLVKLRLNDYGVNTGNVDKDTGTDIVIFWGERILTAQVKSGYQTWNNNAGIHGVNVLFKVNLNCTDNTLLLDRAEIIWKRVDVPDTEFQVLGSESINEMFA